MHSLFRASFWQIKTILPSDPSEITDTRWERLIQEAADAINAFDNFGYITTGILQILALSFHGTIREKYVGWLRTLASTVLSEAVVRLVIQQEDRHNYRISRDTLIYRKIMPKRKILSIAAGSMTLLKGSRLRLSVLESRYRTYRVRTIVLAGE